MAEYRLDDLARISGVSSRNIRAYRERGLLEPPRRRGRMAYYDDYHLSQLMTINRLLRKGYNSAHISEFFARMREGHDLGAILGVEEAVPGAGDVRAAGLDLDPGADEVQRLVSRGLVQVADDAVSLVPAELADVVARSADPQACVQMVLRVAESAGGTIDELSAALVAALEETVAARFGADHVPTPDEAADMAALVNDFRDVGLAVVTRLLDDGLQRHLDSATVRSTAATRGRREPTGRWSHAR